MARVFISYRHVEPDASIARALYFRLSDADHDVFIDAEDIPLGALWDKQIARSVESADYFVPLVSASYLYSRYILDRELAPAAARLRKGTLAGFLQVNVAYDGQPPEALQDVLGAVQFVKWRSTADTPQVLDEVGRALPPARALVKGMRPYEADDGEQFAEMGRAREIEEALTLLRARAGQPVVLHGISGAGKSSFIRAGLIPRLGRSSAHVVELTQDTREELASAAPDAEVLFLDQFEQTLVRIAREPAVAATFANELTSWLDASRATVVFCIRDEYRTSFDTMLPAVAKRCVSLPVLPFRPDVGATVLSQLLDNARVTFDPAFAQAVCDQLAEGVPRSILPALLQLIAQYCRNRGEPLTPTTWDRLSQRGSIFQDHVRQTVLDAMPRRISRLRACEALAALTAGDVKSAARTIAEVSADSRTEAETVQATLDMASLPHARVVRVEDDGAGVTPRRYRLMHDLFVPTIRSLLREARLRHERVRTVAALTTLALLLVAAAGFWYRSYRQGIELQYRGALAVAGQIAAKAQAGPNVESSGLGRGVALSVEAISRYAALGDQSSDAAITLRRGLNLLPRRIGALALRDPKVIGFCADGRHAIVTDTTTVWAWDPRTSERPTKVADKPARATALLSHNHTLLAIAWGDEDGHAKLRVVPVERPGETWTLTLTPDESSSRVDFATTDFSADDTRLAVTAGTVRIVDVATRREVQRLVPLQTDDLLAVFFAAGSDMLIGLNEHTEHTVWDLHGDRPQPTRMEKGSSVLEGAGMLFVPSRRVGGVGSMPMTKAQPLAPVLQDESLDHVDLHEPAELVATANYTNAFVYDLGGRQLATLHHTSNINSLAFSPGGSRIVTASRDGTARIWEAKTGHELARVVDGPYDDAIVSPDERVLITVRSDGLSGWETTPHASHLRVSNNTRGSPVAFSADGALLARGEGNAVIATRLDDGREAWKLPHKQEVGRLAFSPDGRYLAASETYGTVRVWDLHDRHELWSMKTKDSPTTLSFAHDSQHLAAATYFQAYVWETATGKKVFEQTSKDRVTVVGFLPGDRELLWAGYNNPIVVATIADGAIVRQTKTPIPVFSGALSADGRLAIGGVEQVQVLDSTTWQPLASLTLPDQVQAVAFSSDGAYLAIGIGSEHAQVPIFAAQIVRLSPTKLVEQLSFAAPVGHVAFGAHDRFIAFSSGVPLLLQSVASPGAEPAGTTVWTWRPDDLRAAACARLTRSLTQAEWRDALGDEPCRPVCPTLPACR